MKKVKMREVILGIAIVAILCCISTVNYASNVNDLFKDPNEIEDIQQLEPTTSANDTKVNNIATQPENNTVESIAPINKTTNTNTNKVLPKTGVDDTMMWVLIGVSAVAAIYTYKKVRDYNV